MSSPKTIRWGILATGSIARVFTRDLLIDPNTRGVTALKHTVVAVGSSSSKARAEEFLKECGCPSYTKAYGSYQEFAKDPNIDIVYVATPHSHHYQNTMLCLEEGKNVLCEKAFTTNAEQAKELVKKAKEKNLFLMEALWTRYFPLSIYVRDIVTSNKIGPVCRVLSDNSNAWIPEDATKANNKSRMVNLDLAGGPLLDLGIYSLTWVFQVLYTTQPEKSRKRPVVLSALKKYGPTGSDEMTTILLEFPRSEEEGGTAHAIASTSLNVATSPDGKSHTAGPCARIQGPKGEVQVFPPAWRPTHTRLILKDGTVEDKEWPQPGNGHGMFWEADEAGVALIEGRKEGRFQSLDESILIMEVMDEVRHKGGLKYPEEIETTKYLVDLKGK